LIVIPIIKKMISRKYLITELFFRGPVGRSSDVKHYIESQQEPT